MGFFGSVALLVFIIWFICNSRSKKVNIPDIVISQEKTILIELSVNDEPENNLPVITIKASSSNMDINFKSIQDSCGAYSINTEKMADNSILIRLKKRSV